MKCANCEESNQKEYIWLKRRGVENASKENHKIASYFSCVATVEEVVPKKAKECAYPQRDVCSKECEEEGKKASTGNTL